MRGNVMNICTRWASIALNGILFAWAGGAAAGGFRNRGAFCVGEYQFGLDAVMALLGRN